jgi:23S rRNA pseudouridine2604 synthase
MTEPVRLSKRLIELTGCSRREADLYIEGGWVLVDGETVEEPQFKISHQRVELHPDAVLAPLEPVTLLLHLPADQTIDTASASLSPASHWPEDASGVRILKSHFRKLKPCMVLPAGTSGLLVFTQDWRVERKLTEDASRLEQEYIVEVGGTAGPDCLARLNEPVSHGGVLLPPCKVSWQSENRLRFAMKNPLPGQIEFLCEDAGLKPLNIKRIRIGGVPMAKLPAGQWRYLPARERF